ncbi:MAG: YARHG domain-containing protein [Deltaproteobacteria bacterium]|nr:YARHG domain-containing protein [Deltaproteobacteria bacterium]
MASYAWTMAVVLAACGGGGDKPEEAPKKVEGGGGSAEAPAKQAEAPKKEEPAKKEAPKKPEPAPVTSKVKEARCGEPCLLLTDTPLDKLLATYKTECKKDTKELGFENCDQLDYTRNCIYAAHGLVFKKKKWKVFEKKAWYEPVAAFKSEISDLERKNVHELLTRGKACKKGLHVSGADFERLTAWFGALPKKPRDIPSVVWLEEQKATGDELAKFLKEQLFSDEDPKAKKRKKFKFDAKTTAVYEKTTDDFPADALAAIKAPKGAKLRSIFVDVTTYTSEGEGDDAISEGITLRFIYTDKDKLVGLAAAHYLND